VTNSLGARAQYAPEHPDSDAPSGLYLTERLAEQIEVVNQLHTVVDSLWKVLQPIVGGEPADPTVKNMVADKDTPAVLTMITGSTGNLIDDTRRLQRLNDLLRRGPQEKEAW
jgi:hypothetical protein